MYKRLALLSSAILLVTAVGCGGGGTSNSPTPDVSVSPGKYLYVANSGDATVSAFAISSAGVLTAVSGGDVATSLQTPTGLAVNSSGKVYVGSSASRDVTTFSVDLKTGKLSSPTSLPGILLNAPSGSTATNLVTCGTHLFAIGETTGPTQGGGSQSTGWGGEVFSLNSDGSINSSGLFGFGVFDSSPIVSNAFIDPTCAYLFHANTAANTAVQTTIDISAHSIHAYPGSLAGTAPVWVAADASLKFLYVANSGSNDVSAYAINVASGQLTPIAGSPFAAGQQPSAVIVVQNWVYVANSADNTISAFSWNQASGALTPVVGSPFAAGTAPTAFMTATTDLSNSPTGTLLYVANKGSNNISAFVIDATGALKPVPGSPFAVGNAPKAMAVLVGPQ